MKTTLTSPADMAFNTENQRRSINVADPTKFEESLLSWNQTHTKK